MESDCHRAAPALWVISEVAGRGESSSRQGGLGSLLWSPVTSSPSPVTSVDPEEGRGVWARRDTGLLPCHPLYFIDDGLMFREGK